MVLKRTYEPNVSTIQFDFVAQIGLARSDIHLTFSIFGCTLLLLQLKDPARWGVRKKYLGFLGYMLGMVCKPHFYPFLSYHKYITLYIGMYHRLS